MQNKSFYNQLLPQIYGCFLNEEKKSSHNNSGR